MNKSIHTLADLRAAKEEAKQKSIIHEQRLKAMADIKLMKLLIPDLIRDENNNIDFSKALMHIGIASLPLLYKKLKSEDDQGLSSILESIVPLVEMVKKFQEAATTEA